MKIRDIKKQFKGYNDKTVAELKQILTESKKELFNLRLQNATNQLENPQRIKEVRKDIARIQTLITQKAQSAN